MEVPDLMAKADGLFPAGTSAISVDGITAARMLAPGAITSGCHTKKNLVTPSVPTCQVNLWINMSTTTTVVTLRTDSVRRPGPRAEKDATAGAGLNSLMSSVGRMTAVGFLNQRKNEHRSHFSQALD
jgi:hypothetical protein